MEISKFQETEHNNILQQLNEQKLINLNIQNELNKQKLINLKNSKLLAISNSKNLNLVDKIKGVKLHKKDGYIYLITCRQYAANNHFKLGKTINMKSRIPGYQVGRTVDDQMYQVFEYHTALVSTLEQLLRRLLKDYRQVNAQNKDIYVKSLPELSEFVRSVCENFNNFVIFEKNKFIKNDISINSLFSEESENSDLKEINDESKKERDNYFGSIFSDSDTEDINDEPDNSDYVQGMLEYKEYYKNESNNIPNILHRCNKCDATFKMASHLKCHINNRIIPCNDKMYQIC